MQIDARGFPLVRMNFARTGEAIDDMLAQFSRLLMLREDFVFLGEGGDFEDGSDDDIAGRKRAALWIKKNRSAVKRLVKALIYIEPNEEKRAAGNDFAGIFEKFWGYPMLMVSSDDEAQAVANLMLPDRWR